MNALNRRVKIAALNLLDGVLESPLINNIYEILCIYTPWVFYFSSFANRIIRSLSRHIVPEGLSIAIVMDGNRRYAKRAGITRKEGHMKGYGYIPNIIEHLSLIRCRNIGFFAFGKKNYGRSKEEVSDIMDILETAFVNLEASDKEYLKEKIGIVGDISSMIDKIAVHAKRINKNTGKKKSCFLFVSYSSLDDYVNTGTDGISVPFDIIIRPGGEKRMSDFLLCNAAENSTISFLAAKWPILSSFHIMLSILKYRIEKSL